MALIITRFTRFGANLGTLHVTEATHVEDLDGSDELTVTCKEDLSKGDYLVWRDQQGNWREHIVDVPERWRDEDGTVYTTALCINSIAETWDDWVDEVRPNGSAQVAMERVLASSRWSAGTCTQAGSAYRTFYHKSVRESLQGIVETWGGELVTTITCDGTKVTGRSAAIVAARGNQSSAKRFTYTKDLLSIHRRVNSDNPKTRIYAYGRGEELDESGTYGRRIGIADVNGGIPYVEDTAATAIWGRYDASGNLMPAIGVFIDEECEDPATLKEEAIAYLQRVKEPSVTYEADVIDLAAFGREWEDVALGDTVTIVDKRFSDDGLRLHGRISRLERDLLTNDTKVTFGTLTDVLAGSWAGMREHVGYLTERTAGVENVVNPSSGWLDQLISSLNSQYNAAGTYHYSSFEQGEIWSSVPLDENGHATQSGGWAININGMGFRLASSLNADGSWNWRTFGTGEGFTADEITAGVIRGGQSYWNLNTGDFVISSSSTIGGHAPDDFLTDVDVSVEQTSTGANITVNGDTVTLTNGQDGATGPQGPQGIQGEKGADGTSVTVTSIQYGTSTSASTQPSSWSTSAPSSLTKGSWLWVKTTYSNGDSAITKSYVGTDGEDGTSVYVKSSTKSGDTTTIVITDGTNDSTITIKDGEDGSNGTNGLTGYVHTAWANSADGTTDFSTTVSAGKTYLGVYTDNTAADSTTPSAYSWSLIKGTGVTSLEPEYYLSTSSTGLAGGSWSAEQQEWQQGHYYWTRQKVTWTDGTTSYTDPVLESALNSANNCALSQHSSGTVINGSGCTIRSLTVHGASQQDGTPTPSAPVPIESVQSTNLLGNLVPGDYSALGLTVTVGENNIVTMTGTPTSSGSITIPLEEQIPFPSGTVYFHFRNRSVNTGASLALQPSTAGYNGPSATFSAYFRITQVTGTSLPTLGSIRLYVNSQQAFTNMVFQPTLEYAEGHTPFTTYGGIALASRGNNLLELNKIQNPYSYGGTAYYVDFTVNGSQLCPVVLEEGVTYTLSMDIESSVYPTRFSVGAGNGTYSRDVADSSQITQAGRYSKTFTPTAAQLASGNIFAFRVPRYNASTFFTAKVSNIQLEIGSTATAYEPYTDASAYIPLQGNAARSLSDGTEDVLVIDGEGNVTLKKRVGRAVIDGVNVKSVSATAATGSGEGVRHQIGLLADADTSVAKRPVFYSEAFYPSGDILTSSKFRVGMGLLYPYSSTVNFMVVLPSDCTTAALGNDWFAANPVEVLYPLATPQTIPLGKIDLPSLPSPSFSMHVDAAVTPTLDAEWWTVDGIASTGQLSQVASDAAERIGGLEDAVSAINNAGYATRAELEAAAAQLMPKDNDLFKWLRIVDSTLQIGRETTDGNRFYSSYTADGLGFYAGDSTLPITALTRELGLYAPRSTIDEQLKIGGWAFIKRSNGNLTLKYIGG